MIIYFSGTGNSRFVAERLAAKLGDVAFSIEHLPSDMPTHITELGLVFPVYAWGLPHIFQTFIRQRLALLSLADAYQYVVMTCGDDVGYADRLFQKELSDALGREADAIYSVQMTETYICLPGFDVDMKDMARKKVLRSLERIEYIANRIQERTAEVDVYRGPIPHIYSYVLRPLFNCWLMTDHYFHVDASRCTNCGKCASSCPSHDIHIVDGLPQWSGKGCTQCLRCYHHCPTRAIDWGRYTKGKGQAIPPTRLCGEE